MGEIIQFRAEEDQMGNLKDDLMEELIEEYISDGQEDNESCPRCRKLSCFANRKGLCNALSDTDFGMRRCPFYKNCDDAMAESLDALQRLVDLGRFDLIEKYRGALEAMGILDCEDSFFSEHGEDIAYLNRLRSLEKQLKEDAALTAAEEGQSEGTDGLAEILSDEWDEGDEEEGMTGGDPDECL